MTKRRTNVVPFERPAAYWAIRARRHYTPSQLPDAARLMRKALEKSGDTALALELSEIYSGMGCYTAAERCLVRAAAWRGLNGAVSYEIGCCALNRGFEDLGERALDQSLRLERDGLFASRAQEILETYPWKTDWYPPRCDRSESLCRRSMGVYWKSKAEAVKLAKDAWKKGKSSRTALWLGTLLPPREGLPYLRFAAGKRPKELQPHLLYAFSLYQMGKLPKAKEELKAAAALCQTITDAESFCETAWSMLWPREALKLVSARLEKLPSSVDYLRLKYLTLNRMPGEKEHAKRTLQALLEIDPDDAWALHCRLNPSICSLDPDRFSMLGALGSMVYAMPERLKRGALNRFLHSLVVSLNDVVDPNVIYRLAYPIWRGLTRAEKRSYDEWGDQTVPTALCIYILSRTGQYGEGRRMFAAARKKKRIMRLLKRFLRLSIQREE